MYIWDEEFIFRLLDTREQSELYCVKRTQKYLFQKGQLGLFQLVGVAELAISMLSNISYLHAHRLLSFLCFFYGKPIRTWKGLGRAVDPRLVKILKLAWGIRYTNLR